ncbi:hypothetical protein ABDJ56_004413 [Shigella flexneri]|nr:hypothetical protein [Shigella flexneri]ELF3572599.1 hypothetical protein [Shigella flexneri]ELJ2344090.1 hypothetical protein [Escherichia coli]
MEKRQRRSLSLPFALCPLPFALCLFAHMFFPALSPDSVDNRITVFE